MMRNCFKFVGMGLAVLIVALGVTQRASAAEKSKVETPQDDVCIPESVVQKVNTCPGEIKMGTGKSKLNVGTSTKKEEQKKPAAPQGPSIDRQQIKDMAETAMQRKKEKKQFEIIEKELKLLERLKNQTPDNDPEKAEVLKRIADAYKGQYEQLNYMARSLDEKIFQADKRGDKKGIATMKAQRKQLEKMAKDKQENAIKAYVEIRDKFKDYPEYDEILFAIAYEIDQLASQIEDVKTRSAYREKAREYYQDLIRNYPKSKFIPFAWISFGLYYFDEAKDVKSALEAFEKVLEWGEKDNPNYIIAMYYQAWCLFNMQEYQRTIDKFKDIIEYSENNPENSEAKAYAKRSRMELVQAFSKIGNPSQAWTFFQKVGAELAHQMLVKLAELYYDEGHWADAIIVYHRLEALEIENYKKNNGNELCVYQNQITNAVISSLPKPDQLTEMKRQLALYQKFSADPKHDKDKVKKCTQETLELTWDQAVKWHVEAAGNESAPGTKDRKTMEMTIDLYDVILKVFPNIDTYQIEGFDEKTKPTNYRVAFFKSELLWNMEDWDKCGPAYDTVVEIDPKGEYASEAAYAAVLCYNKIYIRDNEANDKVRMHKLEADASGKKKCDKTCKECKKGCKGKDKKECLTKCEEGESLVLAPREFTPVEKRTLDSYNRFVCVVDKDEELVNIKYRRARIYYEANMFEEAAVIYKDIAVNHSDNELSVIAANSYLDSLNALGSMMGPKNNPACYDELADIVDLFIDNSKAPGVNLMKDEEFATQIKSLKVGVLRKKAEALTDRGRFKEAAEVYLNIYRNYTGVYDEKGMCEVLFNTAINMESARLVMPAIKVREKMIELYPTCEYSKKAAYFIGQNYHALQVFPLAAENYRKFSEKYGGESEAPEALSNAVMFYIGLGQYDEAWKTVDLYEKNYKARKPEQAASVFFSAGYMFINEALETGDQKAWENVRKHYDKYLKNYGKVRALDEEVQAHVFIGDFYWNSKKPDYVNAEKAYKKALAIFDANAMEKVTENTRKGAMLNAAAKARYFVAERKFQEFQSVNFPQFNPEKEVPAKIQKWYDDKLGPEKVAEIKEFNKYRKLLVNWGEMKRAEYNVEIKKEKANIQFEYWSEHNLKEWFEKKSKVLAEASESFGAVVNMKVSEWEMAAAARAGDMQKEYMQALYDAPLPPAFEKDQELIDIYRGAMDEKAQPFRDASVTAYGHCLNVSTKVQWFNENSLRCEAKLNELDPRTYPLSEEIRTTPKNEIDYWAAPSPIMELETEAQKRERNLATSANAIAASGEAE